MIAGMSRKRFVLCATLILALCAAIVVAAIGLKLPEAKGKSVKKDGKMIVDCSNMSEGYIMVKAKKTSKKLRVRVTAGEEKLLYWLNGDGEYEVFPLQYGSGKYKIELFENVKGKDYSKEGTLTLNVKMPDELNCFLYPNQYVWYNENTACVKQAQEMCKDMTDQNDIYKTIRSFVLKNFIYDYAKSVTVKSMSQQMPDIDGCWNNRMGICQDLSAMTCAMLRSQGVPARLMIGTVGANTYHAWVVAVVNGEEKFFDPTAEMSSKNKKDTYTTERYY